MLDCYSPFFPENSLSYLAALEHDSLTANRKQINDLCEALIQDENDFTWGCSSRVDVLDTLLINKLYDAGCRSMFLGIESGSPHIQNIIHKNLSITKVKESIPLLKQKGILIRCSFMYDFPNETQEDIEKTFKLIEYLVTNGILDISIYKLTVLPGTELYSMYKGNLRLLPMEETSYFTIGDKAGQFLKAVTEYPKLFPQYCEIDIDRQFDTSYVESFVNYFIVILCSKLKISFKYLKRKYESLYELYFPMRDCCAKIEEIATELLLKKIKTSVFERKIIDFFIKYIEDYYDEVDKKVLCTLIQCDMDIIKFSYSSKDFIVHKYICDVKAFLNYEKIVFKDTTITLFRKEGKVYMK